MEKAKLTLNVAVLFACLFIFSISVYSVSAVTESSLLLEDISETDIAKIDQGIIEEMENTLDFKNNEIEVLVKIKEETNIFMLVSDILTGNTPEEKVDDIIEKIDGNTVIKTEELIAVTVSKDELGALASSRNIEKIYPDNKYSLMLDDSVSAIGADKVWDLGYDGRDVTVAVLDTGIDYTNDAFGNRVIQNAVFTGENHTIDRQGHGTHIAGIIAGNGSVKGVAPAANLINAKVLTDIGGGSTSTIIAGIEWAITQDVDIISMSLGAPTGKLDEPLNDALQKAIDAGIIVITASGNYGECGSSSYRGVSTPGNYKEVITVGAVDDNDEYACFSSGDVFSGYVKPDVVSYGKGIRSYGLGNELVSKSGTSMATPHVAGVAALLKQRDASLDHYDLKKLLIETAVDRGSEGVDVKYGMGLVNVFALFGIDQGSEKEDPTKENEENNGDKNPSRDDLVLSLSVDCSDITADGRYSILEDFEIQDRSGTGCAKKIESSEHDLTNLIVIGFVSTDDLIDHLDYYYSVEFFDGNIISIEDSYVLDQYGTYYWMHNFTLLSYEGSAEDDFFLSLLKDYPSQFGESFDQTIINSKEIEKLVHDESSLMTSFSVSEQQKFDSEYKTAEFESQATHGSCSTWHSYRRNNDDIHRCEYSYLGGGPYWYDYASLGDSAFCYGAKQTGTACKYEEYDCDFNSECSGSLICTSGSSDGCCNSGETWNSGTSKCEQTCTQGYTGALRCGSGNVIEKDYQNSDCSTEWKSGDDCDDNDGTTTSWENYCSDDTLKKKRKVYDYSCSGGRCISNYDWEKKDIETCTYGCSDSACKPKPAPKCSDYSNTDGDCGTEGGYRRDVNGNMVYQCKDQILSGKLLCWEEKYSNGDDAFCWGAEQAGNACDHGQYDCDTNSECKGALVCMDDYSLLTSDGCCNLGEEWNTNSLKCEKKCSILSHEWSVEKAVNGEEVTLTIIGSSGCLITETANVKIFEVDDILSQEEINYTHQGFWDFIPGNDDDIKDFGYNNFDLNSRIILKWTAQQDSSDPNSPYHTYRIASGVVNGELYEQDLLIGSCGDGKRYPAEQCDDGDATRNGDGCSTSCQIEEGWTCTNVEDKKSVCQISCGNGKLDTGETCDDTNRNSGDGCSSSCKVESGWTCPNGIEMCKTSCGDGIKAGSEACDLGDGNADDGSSSCTLSCDLADDYCSAIDGSSARCSCSVDSDCSGGETCEATSGRFSACKPKANECSRENEYSCDSGKVYECEDNGIYLHLDFVENCNGQGLYCDPNLINSLEKCSIAVVESDVWLDSANVGIKVNKQLGDVLTIHVKSGEAQTEDVVFDSNTFDGSCSRNFPKGIYSCDLRVKYDASFGTYKIKVGSNTAFVEVGEFASLIITDSEKLHQRFPDQENSVDTILKQAYDNADREDGVVYDLSEYKEELVPHPFSTFIGYHEKIGKYFMTDNSYSEAVAGFIGEKCIECKSTMIVGDDFVVPGYRREILILESNYFSGTFTEEIELISTDSAYIQKSVLEFNDYAEIFLIEGDSQGKQISLLLPTNVNPEMRKSIDQLKISLSKFKPNLTEVHVGDFYCVDPRTFNDVKRHTLIIIGTEDTNNAYDCMPFVSGDLYQDGIFLQPNVWDNQEYSVIINSNEPFVLDTFINLIKTDEISNMRSYNAYFFDKTTEIASMSALGIGVGLLAVSGVGAVPATVISMSLLAEGLADTTDVANSCFVNSDGMGACGTTLIITIGTPAAAKGVAKLLDDGSGIAKNTGFLGKDDTIRYFGDLDDLGNVKNSGILRSSLGPKNIVGKNPEYISRGAKLLEKDGVENLNLFLENGKVAYGERGTAKIIEKIGYVDQVYGEVGIKEIKFVDNINALGRTEDGFIELSKRATLKELQTNVIAHEMTHNKITHDLGGKQIWDLVDDPKSHILLKPFDEYLTERTAKNLLGNKHVLTDLEDIEDNLDWITLIGRAKESRDPELIFHLSETLAQAKEFNPKKYDDFVEALSHEGEFGKNINKNSNLLYLYRDSLDSDNLAVIVSSSRNLLNERGIII